MNRTIGLVATAIAAMRLAPAQIINVGKVAGGERPIIAVPDLRGSGSAQDLMGVLNATLRDDLSGSGLLTMAPRGLFPPFVPQQPSDFAQPPAARERRVPETRLPAAAGGPPIGRDLQ